MASRLEQALSCPLCLEIFRDPVFLSCSHSFCNVCVKNRALKTCSVCQKQSSKDPQPNLAMRKLVETFMKQREKTRQTSAPPSPPQQPQCGLHSEKLSVFCLDHQDLVCVLCEETSAHKGHSFRTMEEAAEELREELRRSIKDLQGRLKILDQSRADFALAVAHISAQAQLTEKQIRDEFVKLHQFLTEEKESRMKALREEKKQKTQRMKEKLAAVSRDMEALSQTISETKKHLRAADLSVLLQYKSTAEKIQRCPLVEEKPTMEAGALVDQAKHVGNLAFSVWRNMKGVVRFYPVVLDPNSAAPHLVLSEDLSSVRRGEFQKLPENPERRQSGCVRGWEELETGAHSWEVQVGRSHGFEVGVSGSVEVDEDRAGGVFSPPYADLSLSVKKPQRVRVSLDFDSKSLTFTDIDADAELHKETFSFSGGLRPFFNKTDQVPLKILPKDITITVENF